MSRVLVVEDEAHLAEGLRFNLQAEGHAVEVAGDGETALERLIEKRERFDAVVLDVMLPGKSGFDVAGVRKMCCRGSRRVRTITCQSLLSWRS
jgi:DNA-binding response OmpR family regulator